MEARSKPQCFLDGRDPKKIPIEINRGNRMELYRMKDNS
jgi:hypothetical protein